MDTIIIPQAQWRPFKIPVSQMYIIVTLLFNMIMLMSTVIVDMTTAYAINMERTTDSCVNMSITSKT